MRLRAPKTFRLIGWFFMLLAAAILIIFWSPWPTYAALLISIFAFGIERLTKQKHASR